MTNLTQNPQEKNSGIMTEVLTNYFEMHPAKETEDSLNDLLQDWICPDTQSERTRMQIANQVFFVYNISAFIRKVAEWDFKVQESGKMTERRLFILTFFDQFGYEYPQEVFHEMLQSWILPRSNSNNDPKTVADAVSMFIQLVKLINVCSEILEGGMVLCA